MYITYKFMYKSYVYIRIIMSDKVMSNKKNRDDTQK